MDLFFSFSRFKYLFFSVLCLEIVAEFLSADRLAVYILKPMLMMMLIVWLHRQSGLLQGTNNYLGLGLLFSLFGDIFLMLRRQNLFIPGLASFLTAHVFYTLAFLRERPPIISNPKNFILLLPFAMFCTIFMGYLAPHLQKNGNLLGPVLLYSIIISVMGWTASMRYISASVQSYWWLLTGAVLFVFSDSVLAVNKFVQPFDLSPLVIMGLYGTGQYGIAHGYLLQHKLVK